MSEIETKIICPQELFIANNQEKNEHFLMSLSIFKANFLT